MKQDLLHRREDEKRKSEDRDHRHINTMGPAVNSVGATHFFTPPAPPLPAKFMRDSNPAHSLNFDPAKFVSAMGSSSHYHHTRERPHSVLTMSTPTGGREDLSERDSESESRDSSSNSHSMSQSNSESTSNNASNNKESASATIQQILQPHVEEEENSKSRRVKSTGDPVVESVTIHTPV